MLQWQSCYNICLKHVHNVICQICFNKSNKVQSFVLPEERFQQVMLRSLGAQTIPASSSLPMAPYTYLLIGASLGNPTPNPNLPLSHTSTRSDCCCPQIPHQVLCCEGNLPSRGERFTAHLRISFSPCTGLVQPRPLIFRGSWGSMVGWFHGKCFL